MSEVTWLADGADDLYVCQFGEEECRPGHSYGPAIRNHILIHFVASGKGVLHCQERSYPVGAGQGFLIYPGEECFYQADEQEPWHYAWVGYRGHKALSLTNAVGLQPEQRVYTASDAAEAWRTLENLRQDARTLRLNKLAALGSLLRFLSLLAPANDPNAPVSLARQHCDRAIWFLEGRYDRDVSIQETADFAGLSRSHLYRVMMEECGTSPKEMLLRIRMRHAEKLLMDTTLTLDEIAPRVGLRTGAQLGVCFRSVYGMSPGKYRRTNSQRLPSFSAFTETAAMNVITHYDLLIDENNDPFRDPPLLQEYMARWDGPAFLASLCLSPAKTALEIGVGTGRLAASVAPQCLKVTGIDISPKTIARAKENLSSFENVELICADFAAYEFDTSFDVIYSSLTMMHFENKQSIISRAARLLRPGGIFCLSIDKNQSEVIDTGTRQLRIYPDRAETIAACARSARLTVTDQYETEFAHIIVCSAQ